MKKYIYLIIPLIVLLLVGCNSKGKDIEEDIKKIKSISSFKFNYTQGYAINSDINYTINCDEKCIAKIKPYGVSYEDETVIEVNEDIVKELIKVLNDYKVINWDGFDRYVKDVLDGDSFSFYLEANNGISIHASGYMSWPNNYKKVREKIDNFFNNLL